jgi:hypothetical protein
MARMDALADELGLDVADGRTGRQYRPHGIAYGVGVHTSTRGAEFNLEAIRAADKTTGLTRSSGVCPK